MFGISGEGRGELARVIEATGRFVTPRGATETLGISDAAATQRLARWASQGWLRRVRRGLYVPVPVGVVDPAHWSEDAVMIADELWAPCLFTGWTAANQWGLTEQVFRTTVLKTSARVRPADRIVAGYEYLLVHVPDAALAWGVRSVWREERRLRFADPARTVIDVLDDPRLGGGIRFAAELVAAYLDDPTLDDGLLLEYAALAGNGSINKRLGYLVERLRPDRSGLVDACLGRLPTGVTLLDPSRPRMGRRTSRWGLLVNVDVDDGGHS